MELSAAEFRVGREPWPGLAEAAQRLARLHASGLSAHAPPPSRVARFVFHDGDAHTGGKRRRRCAHNAVDSKVKCKRRLELLLAGLEASTAVGWRQQPAPMARLSSWIPRLRTLTENGGTATSARRVVANRDGGAVGGGRDEALSPQGRQRERRWRQCFGKESFIWQ
ncbi:unnamed protein product [Lampetra planeri]